MRSILCPFNFLIAALFLSGNAAADVSEKLPGKIDPADSWVFYAHGSAVYKKNKTVGWKKKTRAFSGAGYRVISAERFDVDEEIAYAETVVTQIGSLLEAGVPAKNIFVGGYSRGAVIALDVAGRLKNPAVNYFLIAGCKQDAAAEPGIQGRFLSLYGTDDEKDYGSCNTLLKGKDGVALTEKEYPDEDHSFFSGMNSDWFKPIRTWMKQVN